MSSLNAMQYTLIAFLSVILTLIGLILSFRVYYKGKSKPLWYLIIIHLLLLPFFLSHSLLYLIGLEQKLIMTLIFQLTIILLCLILFFLIFFIESLRVESPSNYIILFAALGVGNGILLTLFPETLEWDELIGPYLSDFSRIIFAIDLLLAAIIISWQIYQFIPFIRSEYRKSSILLFAGCLLPILGPMVIISTKLSLVFWGSELIPIPIGILMMIISIVIDDRVLRMVPFNVYRLSVMNMNIGLSIFDILFDAKKSGPDSNTLIPHLMTANLQFVQSVISSTERIQFIRTDNFIFIFEALNDVVCFVIADRASMLIKSALKEFTREFVKEFGLILDSCDISHFADAERIVKKYFSFLPSSRVVSFCP
ncbi:hypothetical protein [Candidatus Hodarchaeum mangrovi]